ncbi:MAG: Unknown protein [uncultured Sulfurovum sp.]|uniref:Uncharacterized protein n=1 Tax=uncultured Sulfurovum sp. TaxID=269237 RepID=A0A6S6TAP2_9BACT|nr:MAG: Unknown protein [uncultured Sulfurovum sp.]
MKYVGVILLLVSFVVSLEAGKVTWDKDGTASVAGTSGQGCTQSGFGTEDKNATKANCS